MAEAEEQETGSLEESTDESEEEESEEEPKLKYERLSNGVTEILQKDAASCMTVHDKFLALGTHYGKVYLLDIQGNITQKFDVSPVKINQVSLDESGEHMGVCSEDGKVWSHGKHCSGVSPTPSARKPSLCSLYTRTGEPCLFFLGIGLASDGS
ncbi:PREDICTED: vacuolar protein sorting-associated protein 41 homolog [Hipposideros armiger]|uniref:Vacuolar protein sorting-associated protein 41 homolog n=1 Tax=Hipposideros armiger TaxID=186990 RepID=A0A8B7QDJ2_HIPAR|nr:PREDICTED: vacuolar protein sorting-associated protein 41 homolog [Hipposideros armiger]